MKVRWNILSQLKAGIGTFLDILTRSGNEILMGQTSLLLGRL
jgi:hypothetical protein